TIVLFDTGVNLNCIKHEIIPSTFISKTQEKLKATNNSKLTILGQTNAFILNNKIKNLFIIVSEIHHMVILGSPFINTITPYSVDHNGFSTKIKNKKLTFSFIEKPKTRNLNLIKAYSIYTDQLNYIIQTKK